ncbi:MAG TPA: isoprenylcysteine carboxylmethyltransferase family protein [Gemmatimonadales bacterium]|jgi:protein-S-isoprenylcysteine O-methyltransferase Ste14
MIDLSLGTAVALLWIAWLVYWYATARDLKRVQWQESLLSGLGHRIPLIAAAIILWAPHLLPPSASRRFVGANVISQGIGLVAVVAGLAFSIWAKRQLGSNWSAAVTVKEHHTLIRTGPYRFVRHPIYTGILLAFAGTALVIGEWRGIISCVLVLGAFIYKSRAEERRMRETFAEYSDYERHTAALIPFIY